MRKLPDMNAYWTIRDEIVYANFREHLELLQKKLSQNDDFYGALCFESETEDAPFVVAGSLSYWIEQFLKLIAEADPAGEEREIPFWAHPFSLKIRLGEGLIHLSSNQWQDKWSLDTPKSSSCTLSFHDFSQNIFRISSELIELFEESGFSRSAKLKNYLTESQARFSE